MGGCFVGYLARKVRLGLLLSRMVCAPVCFTFVLAPMSSTWPAHVLESRSKFSRIPGGPTAFSFPTYLMRDK